MAGSDPFDATLISTADVLIRGISGGDAYGKAQASFTALTTAVPCRVTMGTSVGKGKELLAGAKEGLIVREVFMRPWFQDPSPDGSYVPSTVVGGVTYNTKPLTHDHWLLIPSQSVLNRNGQAVPGEYYDIVDVQNPNLSNDHLEVWCRSVEA